MKRVEWMCVGAMSAALLMGLGCQTAQAETPDETQSAQAVGGSGASESAAPGTAAGESGQQEVTYDFPSVQPGQPTMRLALTFAPGDKTVSGTGSIQPTTGPAVQTELQGEVNLVNPSGRPGHESKVVVATGHLPINLPPHSGHGPAVPENFKLQLLIYPDGQEGLAIYQYRPTPGDNWIEIKPAPAKRVDVE